MHGIETLKRLNAVDQQPAPPYELRLRPRIVAVTRVVNQLPVDKEYRRWLRHSLWLYAADLLARPEATTPDEMDDLELIQQVSLGDWNEARMVAMCRRYN